MKNYRFSRIICLLCATIIPLHILAQTIKPSPIGEIPFTLDSDNRIYVTAFANGSDSLRFVVDTGASTITLNTRSPKLRGLIHNQETTENIGTTGTNVITISHDNHIKVGTVEYARATCANIPFGTTGGMNAMSDVDGIIGNNFLKRFNMLIDFSRNIIWLKPNELLYTPFYGFLEK